jgi:hypothetical protein
MVLKPEQYLIHYGFLVTMSFVLFDHFLILAQVGVVLVNCMQLIIVSNALLRFYRMVLQCGALVSKRCRKDSQF